MVLAVSAVIVALLIPSRASAARIAWKVDGGSAQLVLRWKGKITYTARNWGDLVLLRFSKPVTGNVQPFAQAAGKILKEVKLLGRGRVLMMRPANPKTFKMSHVLKGPALTVSMSDAGAAAKPRAGGPARPVTVPVSLIDLPGTENFRIVFLWSVPFSYRLALQKRRATIVFSRPGTLVIPAAVQRALTARRVQITHRKLGKNLLVGLSFPENMTARPSRAGASLRLDIRDTSATASRPGQNDGGAGGTVNPTLTVDRRQGGTRMAFDWPVAVSAAAFRYGGHLWIVFGAPARFDLAAARRRMGADVEDISQTLMDNATIVRLRTREPATASLEREGWEWRVTLKPGAVKPRTPVFINVQPKKGRGGTLQLRVGAAGSVIAITDPAVGATLLILPVRAPGLGIERERRYPTFRLLPTAQGIVVEPMADGLTLAVRGDLVEISNPLGLFVSGDR